MIDRPANAAGYRGEPIGLGRKRVGAADEGTGARDIRRTQVALDPEHDLTHLIIISNLPAAQKSVDASVHQGFTKKWIG